MDRYVVVGDKAYGGRRALWLVIVRNVVVWALVLAVCGVAALELVALLNLVAEFLVAMAFVGVVAVAGAGIAWLAGVWQ